MDEILAAALAHLNRDRGTDPPIEASEITAKRTGDLGHEGETKVTILATGTIFYLPTPTGILPEETAAIVTAEIEADPEVTDEEDLAAGGVEVYVPDDLEGMEFAALKDLAGQMGLSKGGGKAALIGRIRDAAGIPDAGMEQPDD